MNKNLLFDNLLHIIRYNFSLKKITVLNEKRHFQLIAITLVTLISLTQFGCTNTKKSDSPPTKDTGMSTNANLPALHAKPSPSFDAQQAMKDIVTQVGFGPRVPNSPAHEKELEWLKTELGKYTTNVKVQAFTEPGYDGKTMQLANVIASFNPEATDRILILTHWDSRPWADADSLEKSKAVPAANDGGSGTAVMLELARRFKENPPPIGVDLLFDDGEDYGQTSIDDMNKYFLGAKYFVKVKDAGYLPRFAILLDMVGDKKAEFMPEGNSRERAGSFTKEIWQVAQTLGLTTFKQSPGPTIWDDHLPLLDAGIPTVDIIDADLVGARGNTLVTDPNRKYWHTTKDLPNNLSTTTLGEVGKLLLYLIYERLPLTMRTL
ncbi:MAG: M28 family peptidase [Candidatus Kapaibacterium sp.]|jgi:glutaminyl-peptide cyclotransferase